MRHAVLVMVIPVAVAMTVVAAQSPDRPPGLDVAERARQAAHAVVATVETATSSFGINEFGDQLILTDLQLRIEETIKGRSAPGMVVTVEGGTVGALTLNVSDMPSLRRGDRAVFFLDRTQAGAYVPNDRGRGILKLVDGDVVEGTTLTLSALKGQVRSALR